MLQTVLTLHQRQDLAHNIQKRCSERRSVDVFQTLLSVFISFAYFLENVLNFPVGLITRDST